MPNFDLEKLHYQEINEKQTILMQKILNKYVLGFYISLSGGDILYDYQIDPNIHINLISHFIAALSMFGEENIGKIHRIFIEGLNVEMNVVAKHNLIWVSFFRPNMVKDYLEDEVEKGLDIFHQMFKKYLLKKKTNRNIYKPFDSVMIQLIHGYLERLGIYKSLKKK